VQIYYGAVDGRRQVSNGTAVDLRTVGAEVEGVYRFEGQVETGFSGTMGYAVRVIPTNPNLANQFEPRLIRWS
jgi:starch phosphorylase